MNSCPKTTSQKDASSDEGTGITTYQFIKEFSCLGDQCPDTCCKGWQMQLDEPHYHTYQTSYPELLSYVTPTEDPSAHVMKCDANTSHCTALSNGLCRIHRDYGSTLLGDACHFYPRVIRKFGTNLHLTGALSCPETVRLILSLTDPFQTSTSCSTRLPQQLKDPTPQGMEPETAETLVQFLVTYIEQESLPTESLLLHLFSVCQTLQHLSPHQWLEACRCLLPLASAQLPPSESNQLEEYHLLQTLIILVSSQSQHHTSQSLLEIINAIASMLEVEIDWQEKALISKTDKFQERSKLSALWQQHSDALLTSTKRWLQAEIILNAYPLGGLGSTLEERTLILALRYAILRLGLLAKLSSQGPSYTSLSLEEMVHTIYPLARFLDHLADPTLSLALCREHQWHKLSHLRGLIAL